MNFAAKHASALVSIKRAGGVRVVFSRDIPAVDAQGKPSGAVTTRSVAVWCVDNYDSGDPAEYARLNLSIASAPAVFGVPEVFGEEPDPLMSGPWAGSIHNVRSIKPFRPAGQTLTMVLILAK